MAENMVLQTAARSFPVVVMRTSVVSPPPLLDLDDDLAIGMLRAVVDTGVFLTFSLRFDASFM